MMSLQDLYIFFLVFQEQVDSEMAELSFYMMQVNFGAEFLIKNDLVSFCKNIAKMGEIYVDDFYKASKFNPREEISLV